MSRPPAGIVFFDVDGTLVPRTSSSVFLAGLLGHEAELAEAEAAYAAGTKDNFAVSQARGRGVELRSCGAVGDSRSDLPLFASVGVSVAFNASADARAAATATVDGDDLRAVIPALGRLGTAR